MTATFNHRPTPTTERQTKALRELFTCHPGRTAIYVAFHYKAPHIGLPAFVEEPRGKKVNLPLGEYFKSLLSLLAVEERQALATVYARCIASLYERHFGSKK